MIKSRISLFTAIFIIFTIVVIALPSKSYGGFAMLATCCQLRGSCYDLMEPEPDMLAQLCLGDIEPGVCNEVTGMCEQPEISRNVPTLTQWGLIAMAGLLGIIGFLIIRRRQATV